MTEARRPTRLPASPDTGLEASRRGALHCGCRHHCSLRGRWLRSPRHEPFPSLPPPALRLGVAGRCLLPDPRRGAIHHLARSRRHRGAHAAAGGQRAGRPARDRRGRHRPRRPGDADRAAAHARRRRDHQQRRRRPGVGRVPARQQYQPRGRAHRRHTRQLGDHRHQRVRAHPAGADRAHRSAARPGIEPVRRRCDRRRDPDHHAPGRLARPCPRQRRLVAHARSIGGTRPRAGSDEAFVPRRLPREPRLFSHQRSQCVLVQSRRRWLSQQEPRLQREP